MNQQSPGKTPARLVEEFIELRDERRRFDSEYARLLETNYTAPMKEIEMQLLDILNQSEVEGIRTKAGTAYKKLSTSVTIADASEFRRHVIGSEEWDLIDWRANKTAVNERVDSGETLPPGVNRTAFYTIGIRKS